MRTTDAPLIGLALQVGRTPAANLDVGAMLAGVCTALPVALGVAGAVVVMTEPPDPLSGLVFASDAQAARLGELQHRASAGPLSAAVRAGRVTVTIDLSCVDPSDVAIAAAETGLTSSIVVPFLVDGRPGGGLQLLGTRYKPVAAGQADVVHPLVDVLASRLTDSRAFHRLSGTAARMTAQVEQLAPIEQATGMLAERYRTDVEEAARFLRSQARHEAITVAAAAAAVVAGTDRPAAVPTPREAHGPVTELPVQRGAEQPDGRRGLRAANPESSDVRPARHRRFDVC